MTITEQLASAQSNLHQALKDKDLTRKQKDQMIQGVIDTLETTIREILSSPIGG